MVIQWGDIDTNGEQWITFPASFPSRITACLLTEALGNGYGTNATRCYTQYGGLNTGIYIKCAFITNGGLVELYSGRASLIALGY